MSDLVPTSRVPVPRVKLSFRAATMADLPALDALQKKYRKALGYFPTKQFEGYIAMGGVLVAETGRVSGVGYRVSGEGSSPEPETRNPNPDLVGYCISRDQYLKRDELGVIYQLCVVPGDQRKLVGAALVREVFARSAYGCRLYCLWCAQDLDANYFWESMGFLPIAFRAGSRSKGPKGSARVHIFWQRRIREADTTTPWWFPAKTSGGAMGEERLVLPIPPGTHWSEVKPVVLPGEDRGSGVGGRVSGEEKERLRSSRNPKPETRNPMPRSSRNPKPETRNPMPRQFAVLGPPPAVGAVQVESVSPVAEATPKAKKPARPRQTCPERSRRKHDPVHVAKARELRDRYLEHVNSGQLQLAAAGRYDVSRQLTAAGVAAAVEPADGKQIPLLPAA